MIISLLALLTACGPSEVEMLATEQAQVEASLRLTGEAVEPTVDFMATERAMPTPTLTPLASSSLFDGSDGKTTSLVWNVTAFGMGSGGQNQTLESIEVAHNYLFEVARGTNLTVTVTAIGEQSDPQFLLIDPTGAIQVDVDDTGSGRGGIAYYQAEMQGIYTLRVSAEVPDTTYAASVSNAGAYDVFDNDDGRATILIEDIRQTETVTLRHGGEAANFVVGREASRVVIEGNGASPTLTLISAEGQALEERTANGETRIDLLRSIEAGTTIRVSLTGIDNGQAEMTVTLY